uniref:Seipin-1 n=1 Tax=Davidia involucrata TaxID=16924 RepID=A0A5B7CEX5_DAVIN
MKEEEEEEDNLPIPNPYALTTKLLSLEADIIYNCLASLLSPFTALFSVASDQTFHRAEAAKDSGESAVPSTVAHGSSIILLLRKLGLGFMGAAYVCMLLIMVMVLAIILGVGLVQLWVEEPLFMRERLHFDYTDVHPKAVLSFFGGGGFQGYSKRKKMAGVPVGHTFYVSLLLLMPESDFNREIGVFQLSAELVSTNGHVIAKSSQPCMLRFSSLPIRLMRTCLMGAPLLLGITSETQKLTVAMLKHKEGYPRTESIRITMIPRAGTTSLPQLYEAEILLNSRLPWRKELVRSWKWTFYVWTSLYMYIVLVIVLVCCFKPLIFPMTAPSFSYGRGRAAGGVSEEQQHRASEEREISESFRKWQRSRSKRRKAMLLHELMPETAGSSASSISVTRQDMSVTRDTSTVAEDDAGDSESVCFGG